MVSGEVPASIRAVVGRAKCDGRSVEVHLRPRGVWRFGSVWETPAIEVIPWVLSWPVHWFKFRSQWTVEVREVSRRGQRGRTLHSVHTRSFQDAASLSDTVAAYIAENA